jgi:hypothetical protein
METPLKYFADVRDPRVDRTREHLLEEILLLTIAAVLSGASGWNENRRLWPNQDRMVQEFFKVAGRHSLALHFQPGLFSVRSAKWN